MFENNCQVTVVSYDEISHAGTLRPRLKSSLQLIESMMNQLENKKSTLRKHNKSLITSNDLTLLEKNIENEHLVFQAIASLSNIQSKLSTISTLNHIPSVLVSAIPVVRTISARLFRIMPGCSQQLCELSVNLGSIVMDSAMLTNANCDFGLSNLESTRLLDEAKLMADSKIDKQYPNLDTIKEKFV